MNRDYWDRAAPRYGMVMRLLGRPMPRMYALVADEIAGAERVLEVGAGTGLVTIPAARAARRVVATDFSEAMIDALRSNLERAGITNVECLQRDIKALGFPPQSFDGVIAANFLHLVADLPGAIRALRNVLRPGGKLVAPTFCHAETWRSAALSRVLALTGFPSYRRFTAESLRGALQEGGLQVTRAETIPGPVPMGFVSGSFAG